MTTAMPPTGGDRRLVLAMCAAELLGLLPLSAFPAQVPRFMAEWSLSATAAGWIGGIFFFGYMLAVPLLVGLTDRIDARRVFVFGAALQAVASFGFAAFAGGFWSASLWQLLSGVGLAGTYMPGLKALTDRLTTANQSRSVTAYTATYSLAVSLSFLAAGSLGDAFGWRAAFVAVGIGPLAGLVVVLAALGPLAPRPGGGRRRLDFRPVLANRQAMGYILAYGCHCYELMAWRAWVVAYAAYAATLHPEVAGGLLTPTVIATLTALLGMPASLLGNEASLRFGRRRVVATVMAASAVLACGVGFLAPLPYWLVVAALLVYAVTVTADSGSLTAGAVAAAAADVRGATMAVHSTIGFGLSCLGPLAAGAALDAAGGPDSALGWGAAFAAMGAGVALGPLALWWSRR